MLIGYKVLLLRYKGLNLKNVQNSEFHVYLIISLAQIWAATFIEFDVPLPLLAINECSDC
jgi:hypothetical protein